MSDFEGVKPSGWPDRVDAPGTHDGPWEQSAARRLFDQVPGEWREGLNGAQYRRHQLMLARDAHYLVRGQVQALREAYRRARVDLAEHFEPQQIDEQLEMYQLEAARLERLYMQVQLVYDALSGVRWAPPGMRQLRRTRQRGRTHRDQSTGGNSSRTTFPVTTLRPSGVNGPVVTRSDSGHPASAT